MENISKGGDIYPNENIMKEEISTGGYYEGGERYHAEAVGEIEGRVPWASTHIHCITHLVMRMRISIMVIPHICHFFTQAKFLENKIYTKIYTVNCQFTQ